MNDYLNEKVRGLNAYSFEEGRCRIRLDANESFVSVPADKRAEMAEIARTLDYNRYPDALASETCEAFGSLIGIPQRNITAGNGSDELISIIINTLCEKGDRILVCDPDFSMYAFYASLAEVECLYYHKRTDYNIDVDDAAEFIRKSRPRIVFLSNPCSPTGQGLARAEVLRLMDAYDGGLYVIDEAYMDFWDQSILGDVLSRPNVIVLKTCSKAMGLAGLRLGFAVACDALTDALRRAKSPVNVNALTQRLALVVLRDPEYVRACIDGIKVRTRELYDGLCSLAEAYPGKIRPYPTRCNFVFLETPDADGIWEHLCGCSILVRRLAGRLRITAGSEEENRELLGAMKILFEKA